MKEITMKAWVIATALPMLAAASQARADCSTALEIALPDAFIDSAISVAEPAPHCKVTGTIGGKIGFTLWLPDDWNGRFVMGGAGGFVQPEDNQALRLLGDSVLTSGYATAATDTGHRAAGQDASWALNDYEAIVNYGHLAMHRATANSKAAIQRFYQRPIDKSFFVGCSNGGRQALQEAQRYPDDFDAILAGAPAANFTGVTAAFLQITQAMFPDPAEPTKGLLTPADRRLLRDAIEAQCDRDDGLADHILHDPTRCDFDPASLRCGAEQNTGCLSEEKVTAIRRVYQGPQVADKRLHVGFPFGAEATDANGWGSWLTGPMPAGVSTAAYNFGHGIMRYFKHHDPAWSLAGYDWRNYEQEMQSLGHTINALNPDLSAFRERGGKLLMYHGWADVALSAHMSIDYLESVYANDPGARADARLFMMPGVLHCYQGAGPYIVDWLAELERWHATGVPPEQLPAGYPDRPGARLLCAWPARAVYQGGPADEPQSYRCET